MPRQEKSNANPTTTSPECSSIVGKFPAPKQRVVNPREPGLQTSVKCPLRRRLVP